MVDERAVLDRIIEEMNKKNITQTALCAALGKKSSQPFTNWKNGNNNGYMRLLPQIAVVLEVSVDYLLNGSSAINITKGVDTMNEHDHEKTAQDIYEQLKDYAETFGITISPDDSGNGTGVVYIIEKEGIDPDYIEENQFKNECVGLAKQIEKPESLVFNNWLASRRLVPFIPYIKRLMSVLDPETQLKIVHIIEKEHEAYVEREKTKKTGTSISHAG